MRVIGSQIRETLEEAQAKLVERISPTEVILVDLDTEGNEVGNRQLWVENDHVAGHAIEVDGKGYEYVSSVTQADIQRLKDTDCKRCKGEKLVHVRLKNPGTGEWVPHVIACPMCDGKGYITQYDRERVTSGEEMPRP